jgi:hypothetical protein
MILLRSCPALSGLESRGRSVPNQAKMQDIFIFGKFTLLLVVLTDTRDVRISSLG